MTQQRRSQRQRKRVGKRAYTVKRGSGLFNSFKKNNSKKNSANGNAADTSREPIRILAKSSSGITLNGAHLQYSIANIGGTAETLHFSLKPGQSVEAESGALMHIYPGLSVRTRMGSGAVGRVFSGENIFTNVYTNEGTGPMELGLIPKLPGSMETFFLPKGRSMIISNTSFIACTPNVKRTTPIGFNRIFSMGLFLTKVSAPESDGIVWLAPFAGVHRITIPAGESRIVDNGILLAIDSKIKTEITTLGQTKTFLFGGEGIVIRLTNPTTQPQEVYIESRKLRDFIKLIANSMPSPARTSVAAKATGSAIGAVFDFATS